MFARVILVAAVLAAFALPSLAGAKPGHGPAQRAAVKACKEERRAVGRQEFVAGYGRHPFRTCVRRLMPEARNAAQECRQEREDPEAFAADYGTAPNAFGKCVSSKVSQEPGTEGEDPAETPDEIPGEAPEEGADPAV